MAPLPIDPEILHEALRQASAIIIITDADATITYVSRVEGGFELDKVIGSRHGDALPPEMQRRLPAVFERVRTTGEPQSYEVHLDTPSGERRWYSNQISWYETCDGAAKGMISVLTDITRRRLAEMHVESLRHELIEASHRAGMAEIATGVLHNVGNVLNSVNVSAESLMRELEGSRLHLLGRAVAMLEDHQDQLPEFLTTDPKGRKLPALLASLGQELEVEHQRLRRELSRLREHIGLMRSIVEAQQSLAKLGDRAQPSQPRELVHQTLTMFQLDLENRGIELVLDLDDIGTVVLDEQATLQVLANLIRNAIEALELVVHLRRLVIRLYADDQKVYFDVEDNGCGISPDDLEKMFQHGFSTKSHGHGFGLHTSAIAARTMNGTLEADSHGTGHGALLRLTLPRIAP